MKEFYKNKKVLITGHTGFKGGWLVKWLSMMNAKIYGYALKPEEFPNIFEILKLEEKMTANEFADIRDIDKLKKFVKENQPEIIFHLAAQPIVRISYDDPRDTYDTNIFGIINLLEAVREVKSVKAIVIITTDKVYHNREWMWPYREIDELRGYDPYSTSKACVELIARSYHDSFFNPKDYGKTHNTLIATVRAGNVVAGGDWSKDRLIPDIIRAIYDKKTKFVIRSPEATRPWQFVLSPLYGYLTVGKLLYEGKTDVADAWNFGPEFDDCISVREVANRAIKILGEGQIEITPKDDRKHEATMLNLDSTKAKSFLKWRPIVRIDRGLDYTFNWYKKYYEGEDVTKYTEDIIKTFEENEKS